MTDDKGQSPRKIQSPRGTRDLYPAEAARRRWLTERWREVSVRHGFEEVDGPTYEEADLYAVKSGEGILGELFQAFSGKSPEEVEQVKRDGRAPYALRPEFTPTLARMYAAKAAGLPKPCKWFMAGPFFRAERPQRGRLREFLQWNCDVLGLDIPPEKWYAKDAESRAEVAEAKARMDAEVIGLLVHFLHHCGLTPADVQVRVNWRPLTECMLIARGIEYGQLSAWFNLLDRIPKMEFDRYLAAAAELGSDRPSAQRIRRALMRAADEKELGSDNVLVRSLRYIKNRGDRLEALRKALAENMRRPEVLNDPETASSFLRLAENVASGLEDAAQRVRSVDAIFSEYEPTLQAFQTEISLSGLSPWVRPDPRIVRGLAYYTGTVFEVIADGERAIAGGGRYDNLIELFGGPPTPAVGFAMGDVVLSLLLQDKGLMPSDDELMGLVGQRPEVFVLSNGSDEAEAHVRPTVAMLRRGSAPQDSGLKTQDSAPPLHARHSYKATRKPDKLLNEAKKQGAKLAVIIENAERCTVRDLRTGEQWPDPVAIADLHAKLLAAL